MPGLAAVVEGDGRDQDLAAKAVSGQQAVIMTVSGRGQPGVVAAVARAVTAAMAGAGVSRLVAASAYGMVATRPYLSPRHPLKPTQRWTSSRNTPLACPVRGRP